MSTTADELREEVRRRYAESARAVTEGTDSCGCGSGSCCEGDDDGEVRRGALRRRAAWRATRGGGARVARLRQPDGGRRAARGRDRARPRLGRRHRRDPLREARRADGHRVRPRHDRRDARARAAERARRPGVTNVHFLKGVIEQIPLPADSVDVVISNCVINLSVDKPAVLTEIARVLRPGGRLGISDVVAEDRLSAAERAERGSYVGCIAGALSKGEYEARPRGRGLRGRHRRVHAPGGGRHARRDRQGDQDREPAEGLPCPAAEAGCC